MSASFDLGRLHLVGIVDVVGAADAPRVTAWLSHGVTALWLRDPDATARELVDAGTTLRAATRRTGALLLVGDRIDVALAVDADGVQLGHRAIPAARARSWYPGLLGVSCHDEAELRAAEAAGADHAIVSPVFAVPGKGAPLGRAGLGRLVLATRLPVVALGGITAANVADVRHEQIVGVAVGGALTGARDPSAAARGLADRAG